jgi:hypothetical protein
MLNGYRIAVLPVVIKRHFISTRHHFKPGITYAILAAVKEGVTDRNEGFSAKSVVFHMQFPHFVNLRS